MAALPQYLVALDQPKPKVVPRPNSPQAMAVHPMIERIRVRTQKNEGRPRHILLGTVSHAGFRVVKPIRVDIDVRGRDVIASWRRIDEFGTGSSTSVACGDLGRTIVELYNSLEADEARLGPDLAEVWRVLQEHLVRRRAHEGS